MPMQQNHGIHMEELYCFYDPIVKSYATAFSCKIIPQKAIREHLFNVDMLRSIQELITFAEHTEDNFLASFIYRLIGVREIIFCRENKIDLAINLVWIFIAKSIRIIPTEFTISSIGSQGFLSIPLYKEDKSLEKFDFIRLHIWDDSLNEFMDLKKCEDFSIHSHTFFAKSWIITGKVINNRFEYDTKTSDETHSFFEVQYDKSLNEVNQHSSKAVKTNVNVRLSKISEEIYFSKGYYEIQPSKLHQSGHLNSPYPSATFFSFTGKDGLGDSFVVGPTEINQSEINRKMNISPIYLLDKIESQL